ncbi:hypothetical protein L6452_30652 [Arctium lappa]|uniref:Uncharacterized protein n=1 Tax=Arctium lappa TaxID=4217 RepID=A0ACB8ZHW5_ARCLA|nr:hypothetical protein L6452_30652 [Arctium lappa]
MHEDTYLSECVREVQMSNGEVLECPNKIAIKRRIDHECAKSVIKLLGCDDLVVARLRTVRMVVGLTTGLKNSFWYCGRILPPFENDDDDENKETWSDTPFFLLFYITFSSFTLFSFFNQSIKTPICSTTYIYLCNSFQISLHRSCLNPCLLFIKCYHFQIHL